MSFKETQSNPTINFEERLRVCYKNVLKDNKELHVWEIRRILKIFFSTPITCWEKMLSNWEIIANILDRTKCSVDMFRLTGAANEFLQELIKFRKFYAYKTITQTLCDNEINHSTRAYYKKAKKEVSKIIGEFKNDFFKNDFLTKIKKGNGKKIYKRIAIDEHGTVVEFNVSAVDGEISRAVILWNFDTHTSEIDVTSSIKIPRENS